MQPGYCESQNVTLNIAQKNIQKTIHRLGVKFRKIPDIIM